MSISCLKGIYPQVWTHVGRAVSSVQKIQESAKRTFSRLAECVHHEWVHFSSPIKAAWLNIPWIVREIVSVYLVAKVIHYFASRYFPPSELRRIYTAPVHEEILFRGLLQPGIGLVQRGVNQARVYCFKKTFSPEELKAQVVFRVRLTALLFGLMHLGNQDSLPGKVVAVAYTIFGGLTLGYTKEKEGSLVLPIFFHSVGNVFGPLAEKFPDHLFPLLGLLGAQIFTEVAFYRYSTSGL